MPKKKKTGSSSAAAARPKEENDGIDEKHKAAPSSKNDKSDESFSFSPLKWLGYALLFIAGQIVTAYVLKKFGIFEKELQLAQDVVVDKVLSSSNGLFNESISSPLAYFTQEKERPGYQLSQQGAAAQHPVAIVPGFTTSGIEVWGGRKCAKKHFRQRVWTAFNMAKSILTDLDCWREHMMLDPFTGGDPANIRLRAAQGFDAADYFMANFWVFGKIIENLADLGYTPSTMSMHSYDWRLAFPVLEQRDGFLTQLKDRIEAMHESTGKKVVIVSHSMGALVVHYFFAWVTATTKNNGGGGGKKWVDKHVHAYVNIAGSHLGVPKAASALLSGEMRDTAFLTPVGDMVEKWFARRLRRDLWNTWGSLWAMLPKGGDGLWGTGADMCPANRSSDDPFCPESDSSPFFIVTDDLTDEEARELARNLTCDVKSNRTSKDKDDESSAGDNKQSLESDGQDEYAEKQDIAFDKKILEDFVARKNHSTEELLDFLQGFGGGLGPMISSSKVHSFYGKEKMSSRVWHDPTRTPLPYAPNLHIYCLYGTGIDTERAYYYKHNREEATNEKSEELGRDITDPPLVMNISVEDDTQNVKAGIKSCDGDGSVPLISLGYICADAWTRKDSGLNPSQAKVFTREFKHKTEFTMDDPMRGGPAAADHIDVLGNAGVITDFLRVVTDFEPDKVNEDKFESDIKNIAEKINAHPKGGIWKKKSWW